MKSEDIIFYLIKCGDLLFKKYWVYTYIFGFMILLSVVLMHLLDALWKWFSSQQIISSSCSSPVCLECKSKNFISNQRSRSNASSTTLLSYYNL